MLEGREGTTGRVVLGVSELQDVVKEDTRCPVLGVYTSKDGMGELQLKGMLRGEQGLMVPEA